MTRLADSIPNAGGAGGWGGDANPGQEPQTAFDNAEVPPDTDDWLNKAGVEDYKFFYGNGQLHVGDDDYDQLASFAGVPGDHQGPMAVGRVHVDMGKAVFEVQANVDAQGLARILKDYCEQAGWRWGGMTDLQGEPIGTGSEFAPVKSYYYAYDDGQLLLARSKSKISRAAGCVHVAGNVAYVHVAREFQPDSYQKCPRCGFDTFHYVMPKPETGANPYWICEECGHTGAPQDVMELNRLWYESAFEALSEWANDNGFTLMGGNDNVLKRHEDLEIDNNYTPEWKNDDEHPLFTNEPDFREPEGRFRCPECSELFPSYRLYLQHRSDETQRTEGDDWVDDGKFPELNMDATFPPNTSEPLHFYEGHSVEAAGAANPQPKDVLPAPIPFLYDIQEDDIITGQPGQRTSDIPGKFTPGGLIEGTYEPGGKVLIRSMTNMPFTVRHMLELWYYQHPELEIKNVDLMDEEGKSTKLAAGHDIGGYITSLVGSDPTAYHASRALMQGGGNVYVVGGAVRDALLGKEPKDVDLMVSGLPADQIQDILENLSGHLVKDKKDEDEALIGKDFGVFRYREHGNEIEIAMPRRERSTGLGHRDFDVQADHTMPVDEDLFRRDFTANAMAVDLANGQLIDPFHGLDDIRANRLRTLNTKSLADDPLRTVRALVAMSRHGLIPDRETEEQMAENAHMIQHLPPERVQAELDKLFKGDDPEGALRKAIDTGIMPHIFPEVDKAVGHSQNNPHHELELGDHLLNVMTRAKELKPDDPDFALAGLLHDIGKPDSHWTECRDCGHSLHGHHDVCPTCGSNNTSGHFYELEPGIGKHHEDVGADQAHERMMALKYPKERADRVRDLIQHHMFNAFTTEKGARRFLNTVGDHADDLLDLRQADQGGKSVYPTDPSLSVDQHRELVQKVRDAGQATNKSQLAINGNDILQAGVPQGPQIGQVLQHLTEQVIENPQLNTREGLLGLVRAWQG